MTKAEAKRAGRLVDFLTEMKEWIETFDEDKAEHTEVRAEDLFFETPEGKGSSYEGFHAPRDLMRKGIEHMIAVAEVELKALGVEAA